MYRNLHIFYELPTEGILNILLLDVHQWLLKKSEDNLSKSMQELAYRVKKRENSTDTLDCTC